MQNAENEVVTVDGGEEELIDRFEFPKTQRTDLDQSQWQPESELLFPTDLILRSIGVRLLHLRKWLRLFLVVSRFLYCCNTGALYICSSVRNWLDFGTGLMRCQLVSHLYGVE
jgi:hypothetical protein